MRVIDKDGELFFEGCEITIELQHSRFTIRDNKGQVSIKATGYLPKGYMVIRPVSNRTIKLFDSRRI